MRYMRVQVRRSEREKTEVRVGEWAIPVLQAVHGAQKIKVLGPVDVFPKKRIGKQRHQTPYQLPDAEEEYERLSRAYRYDEENGIPYVTVVYGTPPLGYRNLADAIRRSQEGALATEPTGEVAAPTAPPAPPAPPAADGLDAFEAALVD